MSFICNLVTSTRVKVTGHNPKRKHLTRHDFYMADTGGLSEVSSLNSFTVVYTTGANAVRAKHYVAIANSYNQFITHKQPIVWFFCISQQNVLISRQCPI